MECGLYRTEAGSEVEITGGHCGISEISFEWFEEDNACDCCEVHAYPDWNGGAWELIWTCELCGGGSAVLTKIG